MTRPCTHDGCRELATLRQALVAGWKDAAHMKLNLDLAPLRGRKDFQKLVKELEAKMPPEPATPSPGQ
jgi:hypothetical protein